MPSSAFTDTNPAAAATQDHQTEPVWNHLKVAIAASSGFQSWKLEQQQRRSLEQNSIDKQVCEYLRETLSTLAY
ncbi:hypothetical protein [Sodalinema gerasimenkoae]|uniref:hypothetical protein n=1 Tax=Sodalinema gerasimenkoae TaxID=2862348 RepID=UPI00135BE9DD|nr:hypothetical protein [Sodalinema gerasimenkoae]